jgi:hypothetical protein
MSAKTKTRAAAKASGGQAPPKRRLPTQRGSGPNGGPGEVSEGRRRVKVGLMLAVAGIVAAGLGAIAERYVLDAGGAAPQTDKKTMWGPITHNGESLFPTYRDLGVGIYATQAHWDQIAPNRRPADPRNPGDPAYTWPTYLDYAVDESARNDLKVMIQIIGAPPWANGGRDWKWSPNNPSDFADFAVATAKRYPNVHLWMVWGEPNRGPNFQPLTPASRDVGPLKPAEQVAPRRYAQLLDASYAALKGIDQQNLIIGGNTYTAAGPGDINTYQWLDYLKLPDGSRPRMDVWGHNPYGFRKPNLDHPPSRKGSVAFGDLDNLTDALDEAYPEQELKLYLSEWGVPIGYQDEDLTYSVDQETGEKWIRSGFKIARDWDRVYSLGWVHPVDTPYSSQGLLNKKGNPKPGYEVYKES